MLAWILTAVWRQVPLSKAWAALELMWVPRRRLLVMMPMQSSKNQQHVMAQMVVEPLPMTMQRQEPL